jgi:hypothetical protein
MASHTEDSDQINVGRDRLVITASSLGTVFEWYDFFVYGILAASVTRLVVNIPSS